MQWSVLQAGVAGTSELLRFALTNLAIADRCAVATVRNRETHSIPNF